MTAFGTFPSRRRQTRLVTRSTSPSFSRRRQTTGQSLQRGDDAQQRFLVFTVRATTTQGSARTDGGSAIRPSVVRMT